PPVRVRRRSGGRPRRADAHRHAPLHRDAGPRAPGRRVSGAGRGAPWPGGAAWIDGRYCPIEDARISVLDLGVTRSDCTYDVVHVWEGRFYRLDAPPGRFAASMTPVAGGP